MRTLVLNCGSSSVKFRLYEMAGEHLLAGGQVERIGLSQAKFKYKSEGSERVEIVEIPNHEAAIELVLISLCDPERGRISSVEEIDTIGHRVVHGGEAFTGSVLVDEAVFLKLRECVRFAPLHNPPNLEGIQASLWLLPFSRQVAVFDTAFHQTMEEEAYIYALPHQWYERKGIRRYGFHGTSHRFVAQRAAEYLKRPIEDLKIVTCHLGNGASITAVDGGKSVDTSMGFTPLEGLVMGTRCGDIDPAIILHMMEEEGWSPKEMDTILNRKSGFFGLTGGDSDARTIEDKAAEGSPRHDLAQRIFSRRVKKYVGAYAAVMGGLDALVFTGGIGENASIIRTQVCGGLDFLGISLDTEKNETRVIEVSNGKTPVLVIPTNEELAIAREAMQVLKSEKSLVNAEVCN